MRYHRILTVAMLAAMFTASGLFSGLASAQLPVTYVDADSNGPNPTPDDFDVTGNTIYTDFFSGERWLVREFGTGGDIYQFRAGEESDPRTLVTTISASDGLVNGTSYNIYAFFWNNVPGNIDGEPNEDGLPGDWFINASLDGSEETFTTFTAEDNVNNLADNTVGAVFEAAELPFANLEDVNLASPANDDGVVTTSFLTPGQNGNDRTRRDGSGSNVDLYAALVGTVVANGDIDVFIRNQNADRDRVWYDGVGFQVNDPTNVIGDTNGDTDVDIDDFAAISANFLTSVTPGTNGDIFEDGFVDVRDFSAWQRRRTDTALAAPSISVPEPSTLVLLAVMGCCLAAPSRGRHCL